MFRYLSTIRVYGLTKGLFMENKNMDILECIMRLSRATRRSRKQGHGAGRGAFRALAILEKNGKMRAGELAECLDIRAASLTEALAKMESRGLVDRGRDEADSRIVMVSLTKKGSEELAKGRLLHKEISKKLRGALTDKELADFSVISEKLIAALEKEGE